MMSSFVFSNKSELLLQLFHPDLIKVARRALALSREDFGGAEGLRIQGRQIQLFQEGKSQTTNSRHITDHAIDIIAYPTPQGPWDFADYKPIASAFRQARQKLNIPNEWGGDLKKFKYGSYFQLIWDS